MRRALLAFIIGNLQSAIAISENQDLSVQDEADVQISECDLFASNVPAFDFLDDDSENDVSPTETVGMADYDSYDFPMDNSYFPTYENGGPAQQTAEMVEPDFDNISEAKTFRHSQIIFILGGIMFFL